ncbi:MAG: hypothetical protein QOJ90_1424, partial [Actinomycetota bacterium]|nr:hypothetical protein [Actinomycetota bacterium]
MPSPEGPVPDLGGLLHPILLTSLSWLGLLGVLVAGASWWLSRHPTHIFERARATVLRSAENDAAEPTARRFLRVALGLLWMVDGALQARGDVPAGFRRGPLAEGLASSPAWFSDALAPLVRVWTWHPVVADATTVWVQIGLGILLLAVRDGRVLQLAVAASAAWSLLVWVAGEFAGGLLAPGAGWLTGAPGAALLYVVGAALLLLPWDWWTSGRVATLVRRWAGLWLLLGAVLQALPWETWWTGEGLSAPFNEAASNDQPGFLSRPIAALADLAAAHPAGVNGVLVAVLTVLGVALLLTRSSAVVTAAIVLCGATWWLAQDFGVLEPAATDPNAALPLGLLLACALRVWEVPPRATDRATEPASRSSTVRATLVAGFAAVGVGALLAPLAVVGTLLGPADSAALAADSGGLVLLPPRPVPDFRLTDQNGLTVTQTNLRGRLTVLTFLDPVCSDDCPLIANQLAAANEAVGELAGQLQIVAIDSNPVFTRVADVQAFTRSHG